MANMISIPISKGKDLTFQVDLDELSKEDFPAEVYQEILFQGLKQVLNRGQSKLASAKKAKNDAEVEKMNEALLEKVEETMQACRENRIRITGGKAKTKGIAKAIKTEAMRLARLAIKDALKAAKLKVSHYSAKQISEAAEALLNGDEQGAEMLKQAKATVEARVKAEAEGKPLKLDLSLLKEDPKLVAAAAKKAAEHKKPKADLAAVAAKAKPTGTVHVTH